LKFNPFKPPRDAATGLPQIEADQNANALTTALNAAGGASNGQHILNLKGDQFF
jgi:hypothetical protein